MRKSICFVLCLVFLLGMVGCGAKENAPVTTESTVTRSTVANAEPEAGKSGNVLVAYFSVTGNTRQLAEYAAEYYGADLFEIKPRIPYTDEDINYGNNDSRTSKEQNDSTARPEIANAVENMAQYDTVILAYPIWWGQAPRIVDTFLESYDFSGKVIVPFCTSGSSDIGSSDDNLYPRVSDTVTWKEGKRFSAGTDRDTLTDWLSEVLSVD